MNGTPTGLDTQVVVDRRVLAGYDNYLAAQRTVDGLSDAGFPVENVAIVGSDLKLEETVTGRMTNGRAALTGAGSGAAFGAVVGMFLGLFTSTTLSFFVLVLWAALWGAVMGAAFGFINHMFTGGKRDFASRSAIVAGRYDVLVAASHMDHARAILESTPGPADTVVVEVPPSAGLYDPAAAGTTTPSNPAPPRTLATDVPPQPTAPDISGRPVTSDLPPQPVTPDLAPRAATSDLPSHADDPAGPATADDPAPVSQATSPSTASATSPGTSPDTGERPVPARPDTAEHRIPAQPVSPDRPAASAAKERPGS
ncbi:general stress protein [Streptosporangium sp. NPDC023963]|uniref:general stress protein n=1 Tax=Streptosporangium sp. NPDC023963 TaxID=3155608 RepID=UPI003424829D